MRKAHLSYLILLIVSTFEQVHTFLIWINLSVKTLNLLSKWETLIFTGLLMVIKFDRSIRSFLPSADNQKQLSIKTLNLPFKWEMLIYFLLLLGSVLIVRSIRTFPHLTIKNKLPTKGSNFTSIFFLLIESPLTAQSNISFRHLPIKYNVSLKDLNLPLKCKWHIFLIFTYLLILLWSFEQVIRALIW